MDSITLLILHDLISISNARKLGYEKVLLKPLSPELFKMLQLNDNANKLFANELALFIKGNHQYDVYPHLVVPVYNQWLKIQSAESTDLILDACIEAESVTFQAYKSALDAGLPPQMDHLVKLELKSILKIVQALSICKIEVEEFINCNPSKHAKDLSPEPASR